MFEVRLALAFGIFHSKEVFDGCLSYSLFGDPSLPFSDDRNNFTSIDQNRSATGVYFQSTLALPDALKLTGGLRFNKDEAGLETSSVGPLFTFFGPQICRFSQTASGVEIGRASCRARVCQYVWNLVVAV